MTIKNEVEIKNVKLSAIIPIFNEENNIIELFECLLNELEKMKQSYEIVAVNDGSTDNTTKMLNQISDEYSMVKVIHFTRNFGQTAALMAGIDFSQGEVIVAIDADLQNDPADISYLVKKIYEGYDVVSGWRKNRKDSKFRKIYLSRIANWLISKITGVKLHDYGCTLKAYRRSIIKNIKLYGEMHRFIPIYALWQGAKIYEVQVNHSARNKGKSNYGMSRIIKVILDLIVIVFLDRYFTKPIYVFGGFGIISFLGSLVGFSAMVYLKYYKGISFILTPIPLVVILSMMIGFISILLGIMAEILSRTYFESQGNRSYMIRMTKNI